MLDPTNSVGAPGVTLTLESVGVGVWQVSVLVPLTALMAALIEDVPALTQFTGCGSAAAPTVATPVTDEVHVAVLVQSFVEPSEYPHVAMNPRPEFTFTVGLFGVTVMLESVTAAVQVAAVLPETEPTVAVMVTGPPAATHFAVCVAVVALESTVMVCGCK